MNVEETIEFILAQQAKTAERAAQNEERAAKTEERAAQNEERAARNEERAARNEERAAKSEDRLAKIESGLAKTESGLAKTESMLDRTALKGAKTDARLDRAIRLAVLEARAERKRRREMAEAWDLKMTQLSAAQLITEEKLRAVGEKLDGFIEALRRGTNGHP